MKFEGELTTIKGIIHEFPNLFYKGGLSEVKNSNSTCLHDFLGFIETSTKCKKLRYLWFRLSTRQMYKIDR